MQFNLDSEILEGAIKTVVKVAGPGAGGLIHFRQINENFMRISSVNKGTGAAVIIPSKITNKEGEKKFAIEPGTVMSAITKTKTVSIDVRESTILVSGQRHKLELVITAGEAEPVLPDDVKKGDSIKLSSEVIEFLRSNISDIELKPTLETFSYMPVSVKVTEKGTAMVCYDNWHMAFAVSKKVTGNLNFTLPATSLSLLVNEFKGKQYRVVLTESTLYAFNDSFELSLPLPQVDAQNVLPAEEAFQIAGQVRKQQGVQVLLAVEDVQALAANMEAVYKKGEHVTFNIEKDKCEMLLKSTHGKIKATARCKAQKAVKCKVGFVYLRDTLSKVSGRKLEMVVVPDRMMFFNKDNKTFMLGLISDKEEKE